MFKRQPDRLEMQLGFLDLLGSRIGRQTQPALGCPDKRAQEHEMSNLLRMAGRIRNGCRATARHPKGGETLNAGGFHDRFKVLNVSLERKFDALAVRESTAAQIVADQRVT